MQLRVSQPRVTTPGMGSYGGTQAIQVAIDELERQQYLYLEKLIAANGSKPTGEMLEALLKEKAGPQNIQNVIDTKVNYIANLLERSIESKQGKDTFDKINYEISSTGEMTFDMSRFEPSFIGKFVQDVMVFGGGGGGFAGANAPLPDIIEIYTELKESTFADSIKGGMITAKIEAEGSGLSVQEKTAQEIQAERILEDAVYKENIAILELYKKLRNLLVMQTAWEKEGTRMHFRFVAIVLFVELLIKKVREWVRRGIKEEENIRKKTGVYTTRSYIEIKRDNVTMHRNEETGTLTATQHYTTSFSHLYAGGKKNDLNQLFKNLSELYLARRDILPYIEGEGKGETAARFMKAIKEKPMPTFNMLNVDF